MSKKYSITKPLGHRLQIRQKTVGDKVGLIIKPKSVQEREQFSQTTGEVVAIGSTAWKAVDDGTPWCKVGDIITAIQRSATIVTDEDTGETFAYVNDLDLICGRELLE